MRDFIIGLSEWYNRYKFIIWTIVVVIVLFLLVTSSIDKALKKSNSSSSVVNTTTIAVNTTNETSNTQSENTTVGNNSVSSKKTDEEIISEITSKESAIKVFVSFCNAGKVDMAYSMLSDGCKEAMFPSKELFVKNYYNVYFQYSKEVTIVKYNSIGTYKVNLKTDSILTGVTTNTDINTDYITVDGSYKLNVSGLLYKQSVDKSGIDLYLSVGVVAKYVYLDYEEFEVNVKNLTSADITLDDIEKTGFTYLVDASNNYYKSDIKIYAGKSKDIRLRFTKVYNSGSNDSKLVFNNIHIENYEYTDSDMIDSNTTTDTSQKVIYQRKTTTYPETVTLEVVLNN